MYNNQTTIEFVPAAQFIKDYHSKMYGEEEQLLDVFCINQNIQRFANNKGYHTSEYNNLFKEIIFSNLCAAGLKDHQGNMLDVTICENFTEGILKQGMYASVIKYWDYLRQLNNDFFNSDRKPTDIRKFLNEARLKSAEILQARYFKSALSVLVQQLESDVDNLYNFVDILRRKK